MSSQLLLAIDQGTTNSRAIIFNREGLTISEHSMPLSQSFPANGWVEQDPEEMVNNTLTCMRSALQKASLSAKDICAIGITNQRETTIVWDKKTGVPIYPAIVWQDRRTSKLCQQLKETPLNIEIVEKTGLLLDPYFSATKLIWLLRNVEGARARAEAGELLFGTVDTFLLWKLTKGKVHKTDATNASRTLLYDIHLQMWDCEILNLLEIPSALLPEVHDSAYAFGETDASLLGEAIPIAGIAGDQHAATFGQACFHPGMVKATFGTGGFLIINTGQSLVTSKHKLLSTIAYKIAHKATYAIEGSIFAAGATIKWLRDNLQLIERAEQSEDCALQVSDNGGVHFVPAFTGLGAPYWNPHARGAILGLTQDSNKNHIVRAGLEGVCYQTRDLLNSVKNEMRNEPLNELRVDGGMAENNWFLQFLANVLQVPVERPICIQTTALGAAFLAGLQCGVYKSLDQISELWQLDRRFEPEISNGDADVLYADWQRAARRVM